MEFKEHGYLWWRSLLVSSCRGAPRRDRGRRDYIWRCRTGTSPSGRVVCLCVILMLFAGSPFLEEFRVLPWQLGLMDFDIFQN